MVTLMGLSNNPKESERLVLISSHRLVKDFIAGLEAFFRDALKDKALKQKIDSRIKNIYQQFDINQEEISEEKEND